jgi:two-component system sensor histidine kinase UhpB
LGLLKNNKSDTTELLDKSYGYINDAIEEIRKLSKSLVSPSLGNITLRQAIEDLVNEVNMTKKLAMEFNYSIDPAIKIDGKKELMIYRIVQEQINNILKHSHATKATIDLKADAGKLLLTIADNGIGFDKNETSKGIGLQNISSRVEFYSGKINIISAPGEGCRFEIKIPY